MDHLIVQAVLFFQGFSAEITSLLTLGVCFLGILLFLRYYEKEGLYVYQITAILLSNIQVLRFAPFTFCSEPMALGTVLFSTTFLVNDIVTEHFGAQEAKKMLMLGFLSQIFWVLIIVLTLGHPPLPYSHISDFASLKSIEKALEVIFSPSLRLLLASWIAFLISQWLDILVFSKIKDLTKGSHLWLRQNVSMLVGGFMDNLIFSLLAWVWLADHPLPFSFLLQGAILGSTFVRCIVNILSTPVMYLVPFFKKR